MAAPFPLYLPPDARRLFQSESLLRRLAQNGHWTATSKLLEVHGSLGGLALTRALGCHLTVVEPDTKVADSLKERVRLAGLGDKVTFVVGPLADAKFDDGSFDGVLCLGRIAGSLAALATSLRPWLAARGRIAVTWVAKVGRTPAKVSLEAWEKRVGAPLISPRDNLLSIEALGYEPEMVESLGEPELEEFYRDVEAALNKAGANAPAEGAEALKAEIAVHRAQAGKSGVTYATFVGRRKEPGERPPVSRDAG